MRSRIEPMKKIARSLRLHRELILNYFRAQKLLSSGVVEGLNNKAKVTIRKSYGFRTFRCLELALYHSLGKLREPRIYPRILLTNPLFYVSPTQISFQNPAGASTGSATVSMLVNGSTVSQGTTAVQQVTPALFAANANGQGPASAIALRVKADGTQVAEPLIQYNQTTGKYETVVISTGDASDQLFLLAFGNRISQPDVARKCDRNYWGNNRHRHVRRRTRNLCGPRSGQHSHSAKSGGARRGKVVVTVDGKASNAVVINVK